MSVTFSGNVTCFFFPWKFWVWGAVWGPRIAGAHRGRVHARQTTRLPSEFTAHEPPCKEAPDTQQLWQADRRTDRCSGQGVSPCSNPMRNLEEVMKARWAEVRWVSSGVRTVRNPQADAERRRTFSPPILEDRKHVIKNEGRAKGQGPLPPQPRLKRPSQFSLFLRATFQSNLFSCKHL